MDQAQFLQDLKFRIHEEKRCGLARLEKQWRLTLSDRVAACRAIGPLEILGEERIERHYIYHFDPSAEDMAVFREGDKVRVSTDDPMGPNWKSAVFLGLTERGLSIELGEPLTQERRGWTIDEDFVDLSNYYLEGLELLSRSAHGRDHILPLLMGENIDQDYDDEAGAEAGEAAEAAGADDSQAEALAACVGSERYHLVQGPPGTGKTMALALLVHELVKQGKRVLVTAFTHRAIHHALRQISRQVVCPVIKISDLINQDKDAIVFASNFADTGLSGNPGPYVLGITPISLLTSRAKDAEFDVAVIDEASQIRVEAAVIPMLRAQRWFFFGDQEQLPPVVQRPVEDPRSDSIFALLARQPHRTMLRMTYRMNNQLVFWPSENFYGGDLVASGQSTARRFSMELSSDDPLLGREPSLVRWELDHNGCGCHSDDEVEAAKALIWEMLSGGLMPEEIGVVVPFRAQAARIRRGLRFDRFKRFPGLLEGLAVDTVERFQGQERKAMIVSFCSSDPLFMESLRDFLIFPQRLNVAVTRAKTKVILLHSTEFRLWLEKQAGPDEPVALSLLQTAVERKSL
jgi:DNA replication ATP-dependent helicase Dna2